MAGKKEIQEIQVGDRVLSENPETGEKGYREVKQVFRKESDTLIHVNVGKEKTQTTPDHPFWVEGKGFVLAGSLKSGDKVIENFDVQNHIILTLEEQQVLELELLVNTRLDLFYVFMYRDEEHIDNKYVITDASDFIKIFCNALKWSSPEGIAITQ